MELKSINQELMIDINIDANRVITKAVINEVARHYILARQMINVLGHPNDMEMIGTNDTWTIIWTEPQLTLEQAAHLVNQAIAQSTILQHLATLTEVMAISTD